MATHASHVSKIIRGGSPDDLSVIAQRAQAFTNASGTAIALSQGNAGEIICRARAGSSAPDVGTTLRLEGTFTGLCIQSGNELRCDDAENDTRVDQAAIRVLGIRSMVAVPIKEEGRAVGVLAVFGSTAHAFTITHVAVLKTLADQIASCLERKQQEEAYSPEPLDPAPVKAAAVSAAALPATPSVFVPKPVANAPTPRQIPVAPKVVPVRASTLAERIEPAPNPNEKTDAHDAQKQSKTDSWFGFRTLGTIGAREKRSAVSVLMIGAAAVVIIAVAVGFTFKLRRPAAARQPVVETSSSPETSAEPAPAATDVQVPENNTPRPSPATEEIEPKRESTVVLSARPSRIFRTRDSSSDAPTLAVGSMGASASLSNLTGPAPGSTPPRILMQSELEPIAVIDKVAPVYPQVAKQHRLSGTVVVQGIVNKNGKISDLKMISGPPLFRDAAFAAVKQWIFKPARLNGRAIDQPTKIRLDFGVQ